MTGTLIAYCLISKRLKEASQDFGGVLLIGALSSEMNKQIISSKSQRKFEIYLNHILTARPVLQPK